MAKVGDALLSDPFKRPLRQIDNLYQHHPILMLNNLMAIHIYQLSPFGEYLYSNFECNPGA
ncbi:MAG: hypothetical protein R2865_10805 [Deinococcales bacterium]